MKPSGMFTSSTDTPSTTSWQDRNRHESAGNPDAASHNRIAQSHRTIASHNRTVVGLRGVCVGGAVLTERTKARQ